MKKTAHASTNRARAARVWLNQGWVKGASLCICAVFVVSLSASAADFAILQNGFTIRHEHRLVIGDTTRLYFSHDDSSFTDVATADITAYEKDLTLPVQPAPATPQPGSPASTAAPAVADLNHVVNSASAAYHLDPDLVNSVIHAESGFNAHAVSPKGARGLMQLMPQTATALGVNDAFDPEANVGGGSRYLRELLERYDFDLVKALAAYNAGPERVEQYRGVPPFQETRAYVARIVHEYNRKKIAQEKEKSAAQQKSQTAPSAVKPASPTQQKSHSAKSAHVTPSALNRRPNASARLAVDQSPTSPR